MKRLIELYRRLETTRPGLALFLRYTVLFTILWLSLASMALHNIIATQSNPFFYANF